MLGAAVGSRLRPFHTAAAGPQQCAERLVNLLGWDHVGVAKTQLLSSTDESSPIDRPSIYRSMTTYRNRRMIAGAIVCEPTSPPTADQQGKTGAVRLG